MGVYNDMAGSGDGIWLLGNRAGKKAVGMREENRYVNMIRNGG
jgi:hypothetical protein